MPRPRSTRSATFYAHFDVVREDEAPPPPLTIRVCNSLSCELAGAQALLAALREGTDPGAVRVVRAPCMGRCDVAPTAEIGHNHVDHATPEAVLAAVTAGETHPRIPDYETLERYRETGGYETLLKLRANGDPQAVQETVVASGLRGLGGAGFPTGKKWSFVRGAEPPTYLAVNGDEGEPGTIKDRYYLERTPHVFLEGTLIAAWAVKVDRCYLYIRDEYPAAIEILRREIAALEAAGLAEPGFLEIRRGAGAYICGEESAMLESIEGKRGYPRHRPPYVAQVGLWGRPTLVHNVETLYWVARVCREGPETLNGVEKNGRTRPAQLFRLGPRERAGDVPAARRLDHPRRDRGGGRHARGPRAQGLSAGRAVLGPAAGAARPPAARLRHAAGSRARSSARPPSSCSQPARQRAGRRAQHAALLRGRKLRPVHPLPRRLREGGQADAGGPLGRGAAGRAGAGDARTPRSAVWGRRRPTPSCSP